MRVAELPGVMRVAKRERTADHGAEGRAPERPGDAERQRKAGPQGEAARAAGPGELVIYTDGAARGNPGEAGIGVVICRPDGTMVEEIAEYAGCATNNVAEYKALIRGLERARDLGAEAVRVYADSELMVRQLQGLYAVRNEGLRPLHERARRLLAGFRRAEIAHVPRERNAAADRLANRAIDDHRRRPPDAPDVPDAPEAPARAPAGPAAPAVRRVAVRQVDAFTAEPFSGNPAGVVADAVGLAEVEMQRIAAEMNLSETAFVLPPAVAGADVRLRFFTPRQEVDLCGHATIAACYVLAQEGRVPGGMIRCETRAGVLPVEVRWSGGAVSAVIMGQAPPRFRPFAGPLGEVAAALGVPAEEIEAAGIPVGIASTGLWHLLVPLRRLDTLMSLAPDQRRLLALNRELGVHTTHVFTLETVDRSATAHARAFGPAVGVAEDPQTGTASGALGAHLVASGVVTPAGGLVRMIMEQGHGLGRPGRIMVEVEAVPAPAGGAEPVAVRVGGPAVTVMEGFFLLPA